MSSDQTPPSPADADLLKVFRSACYALDLPDGELVLHIGQRSDRLLRVLSQHSARTLAILTAYNPDAQQAPPEHNRRAQESLEFRARALGLPLIHGRNMARQSDGPTEPTVTLIDPTFAQAAELASEFKQLAFVFANGDGIPSLAWRTGEIYKRLPNSD